MSILSDSEIIELCTPPTFMVRRVEQSGIYSGTQSEAVIRSFEWIPTHLSKEELECIQEKEKYQNAGLYGALTTEFRELREDEKNKFQPMLTPFVSTSVRSINNHDVQQKVFSYGISSYGYDCRLSEEIKIFSNINGGVIDPKRLNPDTMVDGKINVDEDGSKYVILPPNSYLLGCTIETFYMPRDVLSICLGKSSYARAAIGINVTPIEPGFIGQVVIEISNMASLPVKIYIGEGIAQFLFFRGNRPCAVSYGDRQGKYQNQKSIQLPIV